ncbi:putative signal recognition particle, SRP54 subunit, GTPase domain-containing protein [Helianthus annuus]|nr:putative signal recognition particle, SRP54 subunit, GTPase domain-containing protein [Helianthus annuus]
MTQASTFSVGLQDLFLYGYGAIYSIFLEFLEPWLSKALKALIFSRTFKSNHAFNYKQCGAGNFILNFLQICRYNLEKVFIYICDNFHGLCICRFVLSYVDDKFYFLSPLSDVKEEENGVLELESKLADLSSSQSPRLIDGILLTKFDTIDDKVGAALSMVYISGVPVMFIGCGQSYTDLKKLNVKAIVKTLLK